MNHSQHLPEELLKQTALLIAEKADMDAISKTLSQAGYDTGLVTEAVAYVKKQQQKKEIDLGFKLIISGGLVLLVSFVLTAILFHSNKSFDGFMYISTIAGIILSVVGFKKIFG